MTKPEAKLLQTGQMVYWRGLMPGTVDYANNDVLRVSWQDGALAYFDLSYYGDWSNLRLVTLTPDAQPALPGAEGVQSTENPTPEFTLPEQTAPEFTLTGQPVPRAMLRTLLADDDDLCPCGILYWQCNIHQHGFDDEYSADNVGE